MNRRWHGRWRTGAVALCLTTGVASSPLHAHRAEDETAARTIRPDAAAALGEDLAESAEAPDSAAARMKEERQDIKQRFADVMVAPPELSDPLFIVIDEEREPVHVDDFDRVGCEGLVYRIDIAGERDARISMDREMGALRYPVWITGGRNVHVIGLELRTEVQPGCGVGEAHQTRNKIPNIHPRLPGGKAFRLEQSGTTYLEGIDIDLAGQEADCFVTRNYGDMSAERIKSERHVAIVNTRCTGIEGLDDSPIGDGLHGDFFQNQGRDDIGSLVLENVTFLTSANGITLHDWHGKANRPRLFALRNVNYGWDERYSDDDPYEISGLVFVVGAERTAFVNVWLDHGKGYNYGIVNGQRVGAYRQADYVVRDEQLNAGPPPGGDFATADTTGLEYPFRVEEEALQ